ncbi:MAG: toprim domain-containing protein [Deltaproteobacteria bacterium]|nr:toprim domain-containing protein [Deltaproteobacteria bacterium]
MDFGQEFKKFIAGSGITPPDHVIADGSFHRFPTNGRPGDRAGYYCLWDHGNGSVAGFFGDWRTGIYEVWQSWQGKGSTQEERKRVEMHIREAKERGQAERERMAEQARRKACMLWEKARESSFHPYLKRKKIRPIAVIKQLKNLLLVPVMDSTGQLHSVQLILPDGVKRFLAGTQVAGHFFPIGQGEPIYIAEGYATGASIHEAIGGTGTVIVAFNAGNLLPVAKAIRKATPHARITICADNDQFTPGNPGLTKATEAAKTIGAKLAIPRFQDTSTRPTDFNDLHQLEGQEAVKKCLDEASYPELTKAELEAELRRLAALPPIAYD